MIPINFEQNMREIKSTFLDQAVHDYSKYPFVDSILPTALPVERSLIRRQQHSTIIYVAVAYKLTKTYLYDNKHRTCSDENSMGEPELELESEKKF